MMQIISDVIDYNKWSWALLARSEFLLFIEDFSTQDSEYCEWWYYITKIKNLENMI